MSLNNFDVMKEMGQRNGKIQLAPLSNIISVKKVKAGTQVEIGVGGDLVAAIGFGEFVGGLILCDKKEFDALRSELSKLRPQRTTAEINAEIAALSPFASDYDTENQSNDTCLATGAHDALRWALGLAEQSISETLTTEDAERARLGMGAK